MWRLRGLVKQLRAVFRRAVVERELEEEMRFHLEMEAKRLEREEGLDAVEARRRAMLTFGGVERFKEEVRDARWTRVLEDMAQDVRYSLRALRRSPAFTSVAVLSLGLGIGTNAAIFSLVNTVMLTSLPVPSAERLRVVNWQGHNPRGLIFGGLIFGGVGNVFTPPVFEAIRERAAGEAEVFGFARLRGVTVQGQSPASLADGLMVSDNFFEGLGVGASLGRVFTSADPATEAAGWLVLGHGWWESRFGGDSAAIGARLTLNGQPFVVVGVLPAGIRGLHAGDDVAFYVSMAAQLSLSELWDPNSEDLWWIGMMARLAPRASEARFRAVAETAFVNADLVDEPGVVVYDGKAGLRSLRDLYAEPLLFLLAIVGVVILIACANLAGLSLARSTSREHELSIRRALGAGRGRLLRLSLTENVLLGVLGGAAAVPVALAAKGGLANLLLQGVAVDPVLDARVLGFTLGLALLTGTLTGIVPAICSSRPDAGPGLGGRGAAGTPHSWLGRSLVVAQVTLSIVLLAGAGLFGRTLLNLVNTDLGFDADSLLVFSLDVGGAGHDEARATAFYDDVAASLYAVPGVTSVAISQTPLLAGGMSGGSFFALPDHPDVTGPTAHRHVVNESYFDAMGIPLVAGRAFLRSDSDDAARVAIVNECFVRAYFGGEAPLGQRIRIGTTDWAVVGIASDAHYARIREEIPPTIYFSLRQQPSRRAYLALRTAVPPLTLVGAVREAVAAVDEGVPLGRVATQRQLRDDGLAQERLFAYLCGLLAGLALLLCCIGVYGLAAYGVVRRTGEFGIRAALGATRRQIMAPVVREGLILTVAGLALGLPTAFAVAQLLESQLFGVEPADPVTLGASSLLLTAVGLLAVVLPARRAARVDPADALRAE